MNGVQASGSGRNRMLIRAGYNIGFATPRPTPMLAARSIHPTRNRDLRTAQRIMPPPALPIYDYIDAFGNICSRLVLPMGETTISCGFVLEDPFEPDVVPTSARQGPIERLPGDVLVYLLASRYCETDRLGGGARSGE